VLRCPLMLTSLAAPLWPLAPRMAAQNRPAEVRPAASRVTPTDLLLLRDVTAVRLSPDGRNVAYQVHQAVPSTNAYRVGWYVVGTQPGSKPRQVAGGGEPRWDEGGEWIVDAPQWSPDSRRFAFTASRRGQAELWTVGTDGSRPQRVTGADEDVTGFQWSPRGERLYVTLGRSRAAIRTAVRHSAERGVVVTNDLRAYVGDEGLTPLMERQGWARYGADTSLVGSRLRVYDLAASAAREPTAKERAEYEHLGPPVVAGFQFVPSAVMSPDRTSIAFSGYNGQSGWAAFVKPIHRDTTIELIPPSGRTVGQVWWSRDGRSIWFTQDKGRGQLGLLTVGVDSGPAQEVPLHTTDFVNVFSFDAEMRGAACIRQNATSPPEVAYVDLRAGSVRNLTDLNPEFHRRVLGSVRRFYVSNEYGDSAWGDLVLPPNYVPGSRYPLVVVTYRSIEFLRGGVGDEYPIQPLAAEGFAVLSFERPRGYGVGFNANYRQSFDRTILQWKSPMSSLKALVRLLVDSGYVDPKRTGLSGLSNGAEITLFTITHSDIFQVAATSGGSARDPFFYYLADSVWHVMFDKWGLGGLPEDSAAKGWQELSPALNARRAAAPLLMQVAGSEFLEPLQLYTRLKYYGKPVEMIVYPHEDHVKREPAHRLLIYQRNIDWFRFWLKGEEDPDPAKAEQYARWRELRKARPIP
jgi:dipeptidyl aminopeptidase/acylaminoacyl peptidase